MAHPLGLRLTSIVVVAAALLALVPALAAAQASPRIIGPWDGQNPFNCTLQDVGTGTDYPDPDADPFCVEFDKTNQNVTDLGLVEFLAQEPARVAAAASKCFYFQHDHWRGSIVQGSEPELWNWDGSYFFDAAKGIGGVYVENLRFGGLPFDASPFAPPEYQPFLAPGGGGGMAFEHAGSLPGRCAERIETPEQREQIYRGEPRFDRCIAPGGQVRARRIGAVPLGLPRERVINRLGEPHGRRGPVHRWCVTGGSSLWVAFAERRPRAAGRGGRRVRGAPRGVALVRTTNRGHEVRRVGPGSPRRRAVRRLALEPLLRIGPTRVLAAERRPRSRLLVGIRRGRVRWLAVVDPHRLHTERRLRSALRPAR